MKNYLSIALLLLTTVAANAQVGIGTAMPNSALDIPASNPASPTNIDGILIPRVSTLTAAVSMTAAQNGMMVFLTALFSGKPPGFYYWDQPSASWKGLGGSNTAWNLTGNAATNPAVNFIGTTDFTDLIFKRDNIQSGLIGQINTSFGSGALNPLSAGGFNTAIGEEAMRLNTSGENNTAIGAATLWNNTAGNDNTATGIAAMAENTNGNRNSAFGEAALQMNQTGSFNTAMGYEALQNNIAGDYNTSVGYQSGHLVRGSGNISIGTLADLPDNFANNQMSIGNVVYGIDMSTTELGKIGIGEMDPTEKLQVAGNLKVGNAPWSSIADDKYLKFGDGDYTTIGEESTDDRMSFKGKDFIFNPSPFPGYLGNVGIGVTAPTEKLEVAGKTKTTNLQMTTGAAAGRLLVSDAAGNAAWLNAATIASGTLDQAYDFGGAGLGKTITADAGAVTINGTDGMIATGTVGVGATAPSGAGIRMMWNPRKAAFRAGRVYTTEWDDANIGNASVALGEGTKATDIGSIALGFGASSTASGAIAGGFYAEASARGACSFGYNSIASGGSATAMGRNTVASGLGGTAVGLFNIAASAGETVVGIGATSPTPSANGNTQYRTANTTDRLFVVGNAVDSNNNDVVDPGERRDAMVITKNGNVAIGSSFVTTTNRLAVDFIQSGSTNQSTIVGNRNFGSTNPGTDYSRFGTNKAIEGHNSVGQVYTFGVAGHCNNDDTRTGGVLGANLVGTNWGSLGYKSSASVSYGIYATSALATGSGRPGQGQVQSESSIGGGFYGGLIGSWSKGHVIGHISSGSLFASYNSGDEYTAGKQIEIVATGNTKTAAYTVTSTESVVYKKGKILLQHGSARVDFDANYKALLGDVPIVTTTPMGQCSGIYIESADKTGFTIRELNNGTSTVSVAWIAVGDRIDAAVGVVKNVLDKNFDDNVNEAMFNENDLQGKGKSMWSQGNQIRFGEMAAEASAKE